MLAPAAAWSDIQHDNIAFGQGVSVNALQMAAAVNDDRQRRRLRRSRSLVEGDRCDDGTVTRHRPARVAPGRSATEARDRLQQMLERCHRRRGHGHRGRASPATGSRARPAPRSAWSTARLLRRLAGHLVRRFAPADDPRFIVYVVIQYPKDGSFGGAAGGPVFNDVMALALQRYGVPPTGTPAPAPPADLVSAAAER